jgi:hypothetical protein
MNTIYLFMIDFNKNYVKLLDEYYHENSDFISFI